MVLFHYVITSQAIAVTSEGMSGANAGLNAAPTYATAMQMKHGN